MKKILIISVILVFSGKVLADSIKFRAFGSGNIMACTPSLGVFEAKEEATEQAREAARKQCERFGSQEVEEQSLITVDSHRGSCWAGTTTRLTVELTYFCH